MDDLQEIINMIHEAMGREDDHNAVDVLAQCLKALTGLQRTRMSAQAAAGGSRSAPADPREALMAALGGGGGR